jgi:hypothetical protein
MVDVAVRVLYALVALGAVAIGVAWGLAALGVFLFFVAIPLLVSFALNIGGDWVTRTSRGRFADRHRS